MAIIGHQSQRTQLIFLSVLIVFPDFTFLSVANRSGYSMPAFSPVELGQDAAAIIFIINMGFCAGIANISVLLTLDPLRHSG